MSRVGNRILTIPSGVTLENNQNLITIKGPKGELKKQFSTLISINVENDKLTTIRANEEKHTKQLHGTTNSLLAGMIKGVSEGFSKKLLIKGVGYKAALVGNQIEIHAGYSHSHKIAIPAGIKLEIAKPTEIVVTGIDKQQVGEFAAIIRKVRKPNVYSGKGIMYDDEIIRRKEGKAASK
ncbi:50S ribosomal protein L6 [Metamycoplasma sualvi]|uniref:50S ribosomal protein L6 n=1 Tax=Metamycoplasma sualvi TaxID=2125 RepID=UPI0038738F16